MQRFRRRGEARCRDVVVQRLHRVSGAERAGAKELRAHRLQDRPGAHDRRLVVSTHHDGERAILRFRHAARHRRIHEHDAAPGERGAELPGAGGVGRAHVDDQRLRRERPRNAAFAEQRVAHDLAGRQHGHHDVGGAGKRCAVRSRGAPGLRREPPGPRRIGVEHRERVAGSRDPPRHRPAHVADADEAHPRRGHGFAAGSSPASRSTSAAARNAPTPAGTPQ